MKKSNQTNAIDSLKAFKKKVDIQLENFFEEKERQAKKISPEMVELISVGQEFVMRPAKRLRPAFVYYGYKACGGKAEQEIIYISMSAELLQGFALVHDDIMDNSSLRRGKPTVHKIFERKYKSKKLGQSLAILVGDSLLSFANEVFSSSSFDSRLVASARRYFDLAVTEGCSGQFLDVVGDSLEEFSLKRAEKVIEFKTSKYTIERPLHIGAALADASREAFQALSGYALPLGKAFQLQDDILGMFGDKKTLGKPVGSDLAEGKKTFLAVKTLKSLKGEKRKRLIRLLGNGKVSRSDLGWARAVIRETGALDCTQKKAMKLIEEAKKALGKHPFTRQGREFFQGIADFMLAREY